MEYKWQLIFFLILGIFSILIKFYPKRKLRINEKFLTIIERIALSNKQQAILLRHSNTGQEYLVLTSDRNMLIQPVHNKSKQISHGQFELHSNELFGELLQ
jgi:hypothetical protein